jgi:hypothetical protein
MPQHITDEGSCMLWIAGRCVLHDAADVAGAADVVAAAADDVVIDWVDAGVYVACVAVS